MSILLNNLGSIIIFLLLETPHLYATNQIYYFLIFYCIFQFLPLIAEPRAVRKLRLLQPIERYRTIFELCFSSVLTSYFMWTLYVGMGFSSIYSLEMLKYTTTFVCYKIISCRFISQELEMVDWKKDILDLIGIWSGKGIVVKK